MAKERVSKKVSHAIISVLLGTEHPHMWGRFSKENVAEDVPVFLAAIATRAFPEFRHPGSSKRVRIYALHPDEFPTLAYHIGQSDLPERENEGDALFDEPGTQARKGYLEVYGQDLMQLLKPMGYVFDTFESTIANNINNKSFYDACLSMCEKRLGPDARDRFAYYYAMAKKGPLIDPKVKPNPPLSKIIVPGVLYFQFFTLGGYDLCKVGWTSMIRGKDKMGFEKRYEEIEKRLKCFSLIARIKNVPISIEGAVKHWLAHSDAELRGEKEIFLAKGDNGAMKLLSDINDGLLFPDFFRPWTYVAGAKNKHNGELP